PMDDEVFRLLPARHGHFRYESGHHGELWLDLALLCLHPEPIRRLAVQVAARLMPHDVEAVCGPLVEGAFVALTVASELGIPFSYAERFEIRRGEGAVPVEYRIPRALRPLLRGKRVAVVTD